MRSGGVDLAGVFPAVARGFPALALAAAAACGDQASSPADAADGPPTGPWRSALFPEAWSPAFVDADDNFLHDFSYAGYRRSEVALPSTWPGVVVDVTAHGASPDGTTDSAPAFAAAIAAARTAGGGVVLVPDGEYLLASNLTIDGSGILLRGASRAGTQLRFTATGTAGAAAITFAGAPPSGNPVALVADAMPRSHVVEVADGSGLAAGDDVLIDIEITQAFIDEHGMTGLWDTGSNSALGARKVFLRREIVAVNGGAITLDVPVRYPLRVRDGAALRPDTGALRECGIESMSISTAVDPAAAAANPRAHAIELSRVQDCFVRDVASYASTLGPVAGAHLQSGGVYVVQSKRVTVADSSMAHAQNHGSGGAGYGFEASASNEVLFRDVRVEDVRHGLIQNWDFGASGLVWLRCDSVDNTMDGVVRIAGRSEYHHRLAVASLFDSTRDTAGFNAFNRGAESSNAGITASQNVFWNVAGRDEGSHLISYQAGRGYVIGTRDLTVHVEPDVLEQQLGFADHTAPIDWVEGVGRGATLEPSSLFEDQLARRLGAKLTRP
jgi:hypothetical protein